MELKRVVRVCYLIGESISRHSIEYETKEYEYDDDKTNAIDTRLALQRVDISLHSLLIKS